MQLLWDSPLTVPGVILHFLKIESYDFLLSDFEPKGEVARKYGVYRREDGVSERALFVIDKDGIIHWSYVSPIGVNPGAHGVLNALESLNSHKKEAVMKGRK
jgi:alkyl hydroperoxide reductase subunit AhpC